MLEVIVCSFHPVDWGWQHFIRHTNGFRSVYDLCRIHISHSVVLASVMIKITTNTELNYYDDFTSY